MWAIKILKGPQAGQAFAIKKGTTKLGRNEPCEIKIQGNGISKEHAAITVTDKDITIQDLNSRNGTFVNGVKIKTRSIKKGDRISLYNITLELVSDQVLMSMMPPTGSNTYLPTAFDGNGALSLDANVSSEPNEARSPVPNYNPNNFADVVRHYFETVVMPGVYKLGQTFEMRWVIISFVLAYVIAVTLLSVIPMVRVTQNSIEKESQRRAMTIAQGLADRYTIALTNGTSGSFDTRFADREEGVTAAFILSANDGSILAPVTRAGAYANEPFVHTARKKDEVMLQQIDNSTIGASVPIRTYDQETGLQTPKAYAMVVYNMGSLAVDDGRLISLFTQVLGIAILAGLILFIFLYRLIEAPVVNLTLDLDRALKEGNDKVESPYLYPPIQNLILYINSALSRVGSDSGSQGGLGKDFYSESTQLVRIMTNPAFAVDQNGLVIAVNSTLAEILNVGLTQLDSSAVNSIPDDALSSVATELLQQVLTSGQGALSAIHFQGNDLELAAQPIKGTKGVDYIIFAMSGTGESA